MVGAPLHALWDEPLSRPQGRPGGIGPLSPGSFPLRRWRPPFAQTWSGPSGTPRGPSVASPRCCGDLTTYSRSTRDAGRGLRGADSGRGRPLARRGAQERPQPHRGRAPAGVLAGPMGERTGRRGGQRLPAGGAPGERAPLRLHWLLDADRGGGVDAAGRARRSDAFLGQVSGAGAGRDPAPRARAAGPRPPRHSRPPCVRHPHARPGGQGSVPDRPRCRRRGDRRGGRGGRANPGRHARDGGGATP